MALFAPCCGFSPLIAAYFYCGFITLRLSAAYHADYFASLQVSRILLKFFCRPAAPPFRAYSASESLPIPPCLSPPPLPPLPSHSRSRFLELGEDGGATVCVCSAPLVCVCAVLRCGTAAPYCGIVAPYCGIVAHYFGILRLIAVLLRLIAVLLRLIAASFRVFACAGVLSFPVASRSHPLTRCSTGAVPVCVCVRARS